MLILQFAYSNNLLCATIGGTYTDGLPLANVTFAGYSGCPNSTWLTIDGQSSDTSGVMVNCQSQTVYVTGLESATGSGAWSGSELKLGLY